MNFALDEDHLALKQSAAAFLDKEISLNALLKPGATVLDAGGNSITVSTSVTVIPVPRPTIIITPSPVPGKVNTQTTLSIQVTLPNGISVQDLQIDFGDGQSADLGGATSASVPHVYTSTGTFTVRVTVVDTSGQTTVGTTAVSIGP